MPDSATIGFSACPHDCPSTCALDIEIGADGRIGRVHGARDNSYTAGVVCAKVARYAERANHPDRLTRPLRRTGAKGSGGFAPISWDAALDEVAEAFIKAEQAHGAEAVWPYFYAGTMGLVMRDGIDRLTHAKKYSIMYGTICTALAYPGFVTGTGRLAGPDPREMALSDVVVIWGTNAVSTQVNVMTHALKARKNRGAKIVVIDTYRTPMADREYMAKFADAPDELEAHLAARTPTWAAAITGLSSQEIEDFAHLIGNNPRSYLRLGYGFSRSRNGAVNMHAATSVATVAGLWRHEGGGAFHINSAIFHWDKTMTRGLDVVDASVRMLDQCRVGAVLTGEADALGGGPPVQAMIIQNTNPLSVAPDSNKVRQGFGRGDLFVCVHEQFMTETAAIADIVLPATMFTEHDDLYQAGGQQHIVFGPKLVEAPGECRSNHDVICALARRLGAEHPGFAMTPRQLIDWTLKASGWPGVDELERSRWHDCQPGFDEAHYIDGFAHADGRYRFKPDWGGCKPHGFGDASAMPALPDHWASIEAADATHPFRLVTAPARNFLNSSFNETPTSRDKEGGPMAKLHPEDAKGLGVVDGTRVRLGNARGSVVVPAQLFAGVNRGVTIVEGVWHDAAFEEGIGINALTGADAGAPVGGAAFHDNAVWIRKA